MLATVVRLRSGLVNGWRSEEFVSKLSSLPKYVADCTIVCNFLDRQNIIIQYTDSPLRWSGDPKVNQAALLGNNVKSLVSSLDISLKRLRMSYVDIFYVHWWDYACSIEEVMNALHNVVVQGKALYLGVSNCPAWVVSEANRYAKMAGKTPFVIYQGAWNILSREFERETIPMARAHGMFHSM